jgi:hypothetical protein
MRFKRTIAVVILAAAMVALLTVLLALPPDGWLLGDAPADQRPKTHEDAKPPAARTIPLASIYTSTWDPERADEFQLVVHPGEDPGLPHEAHLLRRAVMDICSSDVFLASGDDIEAAVRATSRRFGGGAVDQPVDGSRGGHKSDLFWMVVYFGQASSATPFLVRSAEIRGNTIRVTYQLRESLGGGFDLEPYIAWIPLDKLDAGLYQLELIDASDKEMNLLRRVVVPGKTAQRDIANEADELKGQPVSKDKIYSSIAQKGLKHIDIRDPKENISKSQLEGIYKEAARRRWSDVFLVRADNIADTVRGTLIASFVCTVVDVSPYYTPRQTNQVWLVAYLGTATAEGPHWTVESGVVSDRTIRLVYLQHENVQNASSRPPPDADGPCLVWMPVGELDPGDYQVELHDAGLRQTVFMRRVFIPEDGEE